MRQGGSPPTGKWIGSATGGVKAPQPLLLPDPAKRFATTAARLDVLAEANPMPDWLRFMAELARAQHAAAIALPPPGVDIDFVDQAVEQRRPPLDSHERNAIWRDGLNVMLADFDRRTAPERAAAIMDGLRASDAETVELLADDFLQGGVSAGDASRAVYVAAALQVYYTRLASVLPVGALRLLPQRGQCPCCGSPPVSGLVTATGDTPGTRYLYCSLCSTAWNHVRAVCITCGGSAKVELRSIEGGSQSAKAEICGECQTYAKVFYQAKDMQLDPFADDLATLGLDILVTEEGWARHAPNPLLLVG